MTTFPKCANTFTSAIVSFVVVSTFAVRTTAALLAVGVLTCPALGAQSKPGHTGNLTFDVVSVKPNKSGSSGGRIGRQPGGRWVMVNVPAAGLILTAYPTKVDELVGAPAWVKSERFDVEARATFQPTAEQERMMLRRRKRRFTESPRCRDGARASVGRPPSPLFSETRGL
jgi:hypothetical protein